MTGLSLILGVLLLLTTPADVQVVRFPPKGKVSLGLGQDGKVDIERKGTVMRTSVQLEKLQPPQVAFPGMNTYVVWAVSPEGSFDNLGELLMSGNKGTLEATTRFDRFALLVTAEPHYMVDNPSNAIVQRNDPAQSYQNVPLTVNVGLFEYAGLPATSAGVPALVMEARAALAIATAAGAASSAESQFRQARVSQTTMEELFARSSPEEIVSSAAHEAIRRAQLATATARQSSR